MDGRFYGDELAALERGRFLATTDAQRDWARIELDHAYRLADETERHARMLDAIAVTHERDIRRWESQHNK